MVHNEKKRLRSVLVALVLLGDVLLFNLTFRFAYAVLAALGYPVDVDTYYVVEFYAWVLPPVAFYFAGMCRSWDEYVFSKGIDGIVTGVLVAIGLLLGVIWLFRDTLAAIHEIEMLQQVTTDALSQLVWGFPVRVLAGVAVCAPVLIWLWRVAANALEYRYLGWSARPRTALVVGMLSPEDERRLMRSRRPAYRILGRLAREDEAEDPLDRLGTPDDLPRVLETRKVDEVFLVASDFDRAGLLEALNACWIKGARPRLVLGLYEALLAATQTRLHENLPLYSFSVGGIRGWTWVAKRLMDVTLASIALLVTGPLLILPACLAIILDSKGWPVFSQIRVGLHGRHFRLHKLRTMVIDADAKGGPLTEDNDPRITKVGRFLRKSSIDELPQLWNVVKGDMSLVGPRAVVPYVADRFQDWERLSLTVRPGVTGLAQVSGRDEIGFHEKSLLNLYYVRNHSILLDLRIMMDTVPAVLTMEGTEGTRGAGT